MKIGIFDPYLDDLGGGEKYMMTIAQCLSKENEVSVFWDNREDLEKIGKRFNLDLSQVSIAPNIFSSRTGFLKRILASRHFDVIIVLSDGSIPFLLSKKLFIHIQQPLYKDTLSSFKASFKMKRVSKVFSNSQFTKSFVPSYFQDKTVVISPPITLHNENIKKENIILHVGRFRVRNVLQEDYKKQSVMVERFMEMVDNGFKNWKFVVASSVQDKEKSEHESLREKAKGYPIEFEVNKTNKELWDLYNKAKIYWHASGFGEDLETHPEFAEHFGISTVEAMGAGVVPVVFNAGGQKEIVINGKNGFLWNNLSELEEKTLLLSKDKKLLEEMSAEAVKTANRFEEKSFCKEIEKLLI